MKKLLILPFLVLLTGCVTYYYPQTALEDGVYYAEDDPSYTVYSDSYVGVSYYPWYSLDYFYLGYSPYSYYRFGYGYGGFSFGIGYGYSPWYYPHRYYGYYSPWYVSHHHYRHHPVGRPYPGYCSKYVYSGCHHRDRKYKYRDKEYDRYARTYDNDRRNHNDEYEDRDESRAERRDREDQVRSAGARSGRRYVSTPPSGYSGNRGMVIRDSGSKKTGKIRLEPDKSAPVNPVTATATGSRTAERTYRSRQAAGEVRYRSDSKKGRTRPEPVNPGASSNSMVIATQNPRPVSSGGRSRGPSAQSSPPASSKAAAPSRSSASSSRSKQSRSTASSSSRRDSKKDKSSSRKNRK